MATQGYARAIGNRWDREPEKGRARSSIGRAFAAVLLSLSILGWTVPVGTASDPAPRIEVLVLNSYHDGFNWSDSVLNGIRRTYEVASADVDLVIEHMDTKRHHDLAHFALLHDYHLRKYADRHFNVVMAVDNNALEYVLDHRAELFPGVPVVFCGINGFTPDLLRGQKNIAGVAEQGDWDATIRVALDLHPTVRRIVVIDAATVTSDRVAAQIETAFARIAAERTLEFWRGVPMEDLVHRLRDLNRDTLVIRVGIGTTRDGSVIENVEAARLVAAASPVPVYTGWEMEVVGGVVGGRVISGDAQGGAAANVALRILGGEPPESIPVVVDDANRFVFDASALLHFGVGLDRVPPGSVLINRTETLYERHRDFVWATVAVVVTLSLLVVLLSLNVIRRRQAEAVLREREEQLRAILDNSPGTVVLKDLEGRFLMANAAYQRRFGLTMDELDRKTVDAVFGPEIAKQVREIDAEVLESGDPHEFEVVTPNADGEPSPQLVVIFPVRRADGRIVGTGSFGLDIAARKQAEERAQQLQSDLTDLMRRALLGEMATGMAHELNQPLAAIANYAAGTRRRIADQPVSTEMVRNTLETIADQAMRAGDTIRRIRRFLGHQESDRRSIDINETIDSTIAFHRRDHATGNPPVVTRLAPDLPRVAADIVQIRQVLLGLLQNAVDAQASAAGASQPIVVATERAGPEAVAVSVRDWGEGIPATARERIFEPFFTTREGGFGMGLNVCQRIVEQHGGRLTVEPAEGGGTLARFTIRTATD